MRYAIFSDIHGNREAWDRVLEDMQTMEANVLVCLGDVVGYGPMPEEVLADIRRHTDNFVLGNHDAAAAGLLDTSYFNETAREVIEWTKQQLSDESIEFLRQVPLGISNDNLLFVHAEITEPGKFGYIAEVEDAQSNFASNSEYVTFVGHTHYPLIFELTNDGSVLEHADEDATLSEDSRYIVNVGSVGEPRHPDDLNARYVIYDSDTREVFFRRIEFDREVYREHLKATTLTTTPYFLRVVDHLVEEGEEAERYALMEDMEIPVASLDYLKQFSEGKDSIAVRPTGFGPIEPNRPIRAGKPKQSMGIELPWRLITFFVALILLGGAGFWYWNFVLEEDGGSVTQLGPDSGNAENSQPNSPTTPEVAAVVPEPQTQPEPIQPEPEPAPEPVPVTSPPPAAADPDPLPLTTPNEPEPEPEEPLGVVAYWRAPAESDQSDLVDSIGSQTLRRLGQSRSIAALAPDPVPLTGERNLAAMTLGAWSEPTPSGEFQLSAERSFTFEGWIMTDREQKPIFVGGTQSGSGVGWRVDVRAATAPNAKGSIRFQYSNGTDSISAMSKEIELFEPKPHHFAAVWDHANGGDSEGALQLIYDGKPVAEEPLLHSAISADPPKPFQLGATANPAKVGADEVRFTVGVLGVDELLNSGASAPAAADPAAADLATLSIRNGSFERPAVSSVRKGIPGGWSVLKDSGDIMITPNDAAGFNDVRAHGKQVLTLSAGSGVFRRIGTIESKGKVEISFLQFQPTNIDGSGGGIAVELWRGEPDSDNGEMIASENLQSTYPGKTEKRVVTLRLDKSSATASGLNLLLLNNGVPDGGDGGVVAIDQVQAR